MVSDCAFNKIVKSDFQFIVIDDELGVEMIDEDGKIKRLSIGYIERCFCASPEFEVIRK